MDAAFDDGNGGAWFFRADQVLRVNLSTRLAYGGYPQTIDPAIWGGLGPDLAAASRGPQGRPSCSAELSSLRLRRLP